MSRLSCHVVTTSQRDPKCMQKLSHFVVFYSIPQSPSPLLSNPTLASFFFFPFSPHILLCFPSGEKKRDKGSGSKWQTGVLSQQRQCCSYCFVLDCCFKYLVGTRLLSLGTCIPVELPLLSMLLSTLVSFLSFVLPLEFISMLLSDLCFSL